MIEFPSQVYLEGLTPGTKTVSVALWNNEAQPEEVNNDAAKVTPVEVNLTIHNGQTGAAVADVKEETLGAFTVANRNDTDNDGTRDDLDNGGVSGEVDLMKLVLHKPDPFLGGTVLLSVPNNSVRLWSESTKSNEIILDQERTAQFDLSAGDKTIWVEATDGSLTVGDIEITMGYLGVMDTVKATGIWTSEVAILTDQAQSTATAGSGNQITLASSFGFTPGLWLHVFDQGSWEHYRIVGKNLLTDTLTLDDNLRTTINGGEIVRTGFWEEVDKPDLLNSFEQRASTFGGDLSDGAMLGLNSHFYNSIGMRLMLSPAGIGEIIKNHPESGIVVDITRQKISRGWTYATQGAQATPLAGFDVDEFPSGDVPNDDGPNPAGPPPGQQDEDTDPFVKPDGSVSDNVYVRDMPGPKTENTGGTFRMVLRWNFKEFIRIKLDGTAFTNQNLLLEGSRASGKGLWHSRMDLVDDGTGVWKRNPQAPVFGNSIDSLNINLGEAP